MHQQGRLGYEIQSLWDTAADTVSGFLDVFTDTYLGKADSLRDGTEYEAIELPRDLYAHPGAQTEWWYYTGHAVTDSGNRFGFEFVFFKRRTDLDRFGVVPLRLLGNPIFFSHFAISDHHDQSFRYAHRKSSNGMFDFPAFASDKHYYLRIGDWVIRESGGVHVLRASINSDMTFEANLTPKKQVALHGIKGDGVSFKDEGEASRYFSYTRMELEGDVSRNDVVEHFKGTAWMDREFGTWTATEKQTGWDWFSIQLNDGTELMCYQLRDSSNAVTEYSSGVFVSEIGEITRLSNSDFSISPSGYWKSRRSGAVYPSGWKIEVPGLSLNLVVDPLIEDQELDTRGTTMIIYWEGACEVNGTRNGAEIAGNAYVELVGYDRSHESPNLAHFLMGSQFEYPLKTVFG